MEFYKKYLDGSQFCNTSFIIDVPPVSLPNVVPVDQLLSDFQNEIIDLLQNDIGSINYFGLVPNITADGVLVRFDVPQTVVAIDVNADPQLL